MKEGREPTEVFCSICNNCFSIKFKAAADNGKTQEKYFNCFVSSNTKIVSLFHPQSSGLADKKSAAEATLAFYRS